MARKQKGPRPKHVPQRTCVACRATSAKRTLIRLVRTEQGVEVDPTGKKPGRGAYICASRSCWEAALQNNQIGRALRIQVQPANREALADCLQTLTEAVPMEEGTMAR